MYVNISTSYRMYLCIFSLSLCAQQKSKCSLITQTRTRKMCVLLCIHEHQRNNNNNDHHIEWIMIYCSIFSISSSYYTSCMPISLPPSLTIHHPTITLRRDGASFCSCLHAFFSLSLSTYVLVVHIARSFLCVNMLSNWWLYDVICVSISDWFIFYTILCSLSLSHIFLFLLFFFSLMKNNWEKLKSAHGIKIIWEKNLWFKKKL